MPSASIKRRVYGILRTTFSQATIDDGDQQGTSDNRLRPQAANGVDAMGQASNSNNSFISQCLLNRKRDTKYEMEIYSGKTGLDLPLLMLESLSTNVRASYTGPEGGLTEVGCVRHQPIVRMANLDDELCLSFDGDLSEIMDESDCSMTGDGTSTCNNHHCRQSSSSGLIGSCSSLVLDTGDTPRSDTEKYDWKNFDEERCFGVSTSLYELNPLTGVNAGNPIADAFGIVSRDNNVIIALADGVNWGEGARLAARCAVRGAIDHLNYHMFDGQCRTTTDVFHQLLGAFHSAHALILQEDGSLTTLCVAVAIQLKRSDTWALCVCNVGDSLCFVYNPIVGVREVTVASHDICQMRDMRDAGGALGPVDGTNPQLHNLTCSMTFVEPDDMIFITSDGVSDNFDPVVGKFCVIKRPSQADNLAENCKTVAVSFGDDANNCDLDYARTRACNASLPCVDAEQRHQLMLLRMSDIISNGILPPAMHSKHPSPEGQINDGRGIVVSASALCHNLIQFARQLSMAKRRTLEDPELYHLEKRLSKSEQRNHRRMVRCKLSEMPGKLDHASVVAFKVGIWPTEPVRSASDTEAIWLNGLSNLNGSTVTLQGDQSIYAYNDDTCDGCDHCDEITCDVSFELINDCAAYASISLTNADHHRCDASASLHLHIDNAPNELLDHEQLTKKRDATNISPYEQTPVSIKSNGKPTRHKHPRGSIARHTLSVDVAWLKKFAVTKNTNNTVTDERDRSALSKSESPVVSTGHRAPAITIGQRIRNLMGSARNVRQQSSNNSAVAAVATNGISNVAECSRNNPSSRKLVASANSSPRKKVQLY